MFGIESIHFGRPFEETWGDLIARRNPSSIGFSIRCCRLEVLVLRHGPMDFSQVVVEYFDGHLSKLNLPHPKSRDMDLLFAHTHTHHNQWVKGPMVHSLFVLLE